MTLTWHCLVALAVLAPVASGACQEMGPMIGAVSTTEPGNYGVVIDAGSSGSRIRVYTWEDEEDLLKLPNIREVYCHPKNPGVSDCATRQDLVDHILELVGKAASYVPAARHKTSSIYFMATAGKFKVSYLTIVVIISTVCFVQIIYIAPRIIFIHSSKASLTREIKSSFFRSRNSL